MSEEIKINPEEFEKKSKDELKILGQFWRRSICRYYNRRTTVLFKR